MKARFQNLSDFRFDTSPQISCGAWVPVTANNQLWYLGASDSQHSLLPSNLNQVSLQYRKALIKRKPYWNTVYRFLAWVLNIL